MRVEIQKSWFSLEECAANPQKLYIFGDNMIRKGKGGQASIRDADNSLGVATKRLPTSNEDAYFSDQDDEQNVILDDIKLILFNLKEYDTLVLPFDGLGTGLSKMPEKSPVLFEWMVSEIESIFEVEYRQK